MNALLEELYQKQPHINETLVKGFGVTQVPKAMEYLDKIIVSSMKSATPKFQYLGYRRLTPEEEFNEKINKTGRGEHDIASSDIVMYELFFEYDGQPIPRKYIYIPFVRDASIMTISGTKYCIVPVLTDTVISPSNNEVFVRLLKIKQFFRHVTRNILKNNENLIAEITYSDALATLDENKKNVLGKVHAPASLFVFGKYGIKETFKRYANTDIVITKDNIEAYKLRDTHDIYKSTHIKPKSLKVRDYAHNELIICIPKKTNSQLAEKLAGTVIYTFDMLPKVVDNIVEAISVGGDVEKTEWKIIIGRLAYKDYYSTARAYDLIEDKYLAIESYLDVIVKEKLKEIDVYVETYYDLIIHMVSEYGKYLIKGKEYTNDIYNRYIDILYYLMFNFIYGVNRMIQDINNMSKNKKLTVTNVSKLMVRRLSSKTIFGITKSGNMNICVAPIDSTTDSMYPKMTALLELQERARGVVKEANNTFPSNTRKITGPDLFIGSIYNLPKKYPTPKVRLNPFAKFDDVTGRIKPDPDIKEKIDLLDMLLTGRTDDAKAIEIVSDEKIEEINI